MIHPLLDYRHIKEYVLYGLGAAIAFIIPVIIFLTRHRYENFYYLFLGAGLFMLVILFYTVRLSRRPYDKKRALSMVIAGHFATLAGIVFSCILSAICFIFFDTNLFETNSPDEIIASAPATINPTRSLSLLFMILSVATIGNFSVGSFISVVTAYASKVNQTKDKVVPLKTEI